MKGCRVYFKYLCEHGALTEFVRDLEGPSYPPLLEDFCQWMRQYRGVREMTLERYCGFITDLLHTLGDDPRFFDAHSLRGFVLERASHHGFPAARLMVTAVRMFLRFLISHGACAPSLEYAIPTFAHWRLSSLPRYLPPSEVELVVASCEDTSAVGARDRAIILLLARLGLRSQEVLGIGLNDLDWRDASVCVGGVKGGHKVRLPLPQEVGDAILTYLKYRPPLDTDQLFVRVFAPLGPLKCIRSLVRRALHRAGVETPSYGTHVFRHSVATRMLREGASLQGIQAVLRHRSFQTTLHYAKVDFSALKEIAQPWPEVG
jgi:site-specific recombinase XerD